ncbi:hypothetical protein LTR37_007911 [Vermiconidia calcicola]|uniref:Uncharacterized protein n=1 Tax=Vermiconidia calcicola TaxID=1690605 RepID=A0ACC3NCM8_9PEZI|nr:hypothetical protein LTR37_007911 [Vermiconidia calcicola]
MKAQKRAPSACWSCRASKVRCDVARTGVPCSRCRLRGENGCRLVPSKRGRHHQNSKQREQPTQTDSDQRPCLAGGETTVTLGDPPLNSPPSRNPSGSIPTASQQPAAGSILQGWQQPAQERSESPQALSQHTASTYRPRAFTEPSWNAVFETLLDSQRQDGAVENATVTFLGESFPLSHLLSSIAQRGGIHVLHPPEVHDEGTLPHRHGSPARFSDEDIRYLAANHCLSMPPKDCLDVLVPAFVERVYPLYPVVILRDFLGDLRSGSLPLILLNAVCCAGSSFCDLADITPLGFKSRKDARDTFYRRAKLLFDFGYESNKITILQSTTLMSFWPSRPRDTWTFYHWIGFSVTLAESLGVHRSMAQAHMSDKNRSLLKRIWFTLVIRDAWGAALFGRPFRINDRQCDADQPSLNDFQYDVLDWDEASSARSCRLYFVFASSLALILRPIVGLRSHPQTPAEQHNTTIEALRSDLANWRTSVPIELNWNALSAPDSVYAAILSVLYNNTLILAHLPSSTPQSSVETAQPTTSQPLSDTDPFLNIVTGGSESILSTSSLLVTRNQLTSAPHEMFTGIFLAQVLLYKGITAEETNASKLAKSQTDCFQMVFHQIRDLWEPASWIMHLFKVLSERSNGIRSTSSTTEYDWVGDGAFSGDTFADIQQYLGNLNVFDPAWTSYQGFDGLFD